MRCFFAPSQIDTCTAALLKDGKRWADETKRPYQVHTSQSVVEFNEMVARHGKTPIAWMRELGVLGPNTILGHAIIVGGSSWTNYPAGDVQIMADAGCSVAHAVWVFARRGIAMESFGRYRAAGVNMALGTDTNPQSVIEAMRWAAVVAKMMERQTGVHHRRARLRRGHPGRRAGARARRSRPHRARRPRGPRPVEGARRGG